MTCRSVYLAAYPVADYYLATSARATVAISKGKAMIVYQSLRAALLSRVAVHGSRAAVEGVDVAGWVRLEDGQLFFEL